MTTNIDQDNKTRLGQCNPHEFADLLRQGKLDLGQFLEDMSGMVTETLTVDGSLQATLSRVPVSPVVCAFTEGANHVPLTQMPQGETLGTAEFSVNLGTRGLTAGGTVANGEELTVIYLGLTPNTANTESLLAERLDEDFED